jgi:hypothetical protein
VRERKRERKREMKKGKQSKANKPKLWNIAKAVLREIYKLNAQIKKRKGIRLSRATVATQ